MVVLVVTDVQVGDIHTITFGDIDTECIKMGTFMAPSTIARPCCGGGGLAPSRVCTNIGRSNRNIETKPTPDTGVRHRREVVWDQEHGGQVDYWGMGGDSEAVGLMLVER